MNEKKPLEYDPARTLTNNMMGLVWAMVIFLGAIVITEIAKNGEASTASWGQFAFALGWATAKAGDILQNRYGTSKQSGDKDKVIAQQARSQALAQDALLDPAVTFTGPAKQQSALLPGDVPAVQPTSEVKL